MRDRSVDSFIAIVEAFSGDGSRRGNFSEVHAALERALRDAQRQALVEATALIQRRIFSNEEGDPVGQNSWAAGFEDGLQEAIETIQGQLAEFS